MPSRIEARARQFACKENGTRGRLRLNERW